MSENSRDDRIVRIVAVAGGSGFIGRAIVREANLQQFKDHPNFAEKMNAPEAPSEAPMRFRNS